MTCGSDPSQRHTKRQSSGACGLREWTCWITAVSSDFPSAPAFRHGCFEVLDGALADGELIAVRQQTVHSFQHPQQDAGSLLSMRKGLSTRAGSRSFTDEVVISIYPNEKHCDCAINFLEIHVQTHKLLEIYGRTK